MSFKQLNLHVDVSGLKARLKEKAHLFGQFPMRAQTPGSPHTEMQDIWVRYKDITPHIESGDFSGFADEHDSVWYPAYYELPESENIIFDVMAHVKGERLGGILITKLPPGGKIRPHVDSGWHASYYDKYYVPIENHDGAIFGFESGVIAPDEGDVYWFDNSYLHWVNNDSDADRMAMIICIKRSA